MSRAIRATAGLIALGAAAGLIISGVAYVSRSSGINGTEGALLVIASSAAILLAALALAFWPAMRGGLRGLLVFLLLLGILGTGLAAYLLDNIWLLIAMAVCLVGWLLNIMSPRSSRTSVVHGAKTVTGKASS